MLTRQYRFATRGIDLALRTARQAIDVAGDIAGGVAGELAGRLGLRHGPGEPEVVTGEVMPQPEPPPVAAP
ncbi:MAG: hypothetical protein ACRDPM_23590, partial [Solirubrobacteraceae bacterium]